MVYLHVHLHVGVCTITRCTDVNLIQNWEREFGKWLGKERLLVFAVMSDNRVEVSICKLHVVNNLHVLDVH